MEIRDDDDTEDAELGVEPDSDVPKEILNASVHQVAGGSKTH